LYFSSRNSCNKTAVHASSISIHKKYLHCSQVPKPCHRVETYRDVTDRRKHYGRLRYHVHTFFQATGRKMINCACSGSLK
jgi:hypothetical protein